MPSASLAVWLFTRALVLPHAPATLPVAAPGNFPSSGSVFGAIETSVAAVTSDRFDATGAGVGIAPKLGAYGGSWTQTSYKLGDLELTNPLRPGTPLVLPDAAALESASITTAPSAVDVSATGPRLELAPLRPGTQAAMVVQGVFSPSGWAASPTDPPAISALQSLEDASLVLSGPIAGERAGGVFAAHVSQATRTDRHEPPDQTAKLASFTGHVVITPRPHDEVRVLGVYQRADHPNDAWIPLEHAARAQDHLSVAQVAWERTAPGRLAWRVAGGVQHAFLDPAATATMPTIDSVNDGAVLPIVMQPAGAATVLRLAGDLRQRPSSSSPHDWRVGVTFERDVMHPEILAAPGAAETVDGLAARVWLLDPAASSSVWHETTSAIFASDRVTLGSRVHVEGSVRLETISGSNGGATGVSWADVYPRGRVEATVSERAHLGVFVDVSRAGLPLPPLALAFGDPASPTGRVQTWMDANHDGIAEVGEVGPLVQRIGPGAGTSGLSEIDAALARPVETQTVFGMTIDRPRWAVAFSGIIRRQSSPIGVADSGASYTLIQVPDEGLDYPGPKTTVLDTYSREPSSFGLDHYLLTNTSGLTPTFQGLDLTVQVRSERVALSVGATAGRAFATAAVRGFRVDENDPAVLDVSADPNALVNGRGRPFHDCGYTAKVGLALHLPYAINIGTLVRYQDGQPFARLAEATALAQGAEPVRAFPNGRTRFTFVLTLDLRAQKDFTLGRARLGVFLDAFDLLNTTREVEEITASSPDFRATSAVEPPRSVRLGFRLGF